MMPTHSVWKRPATALKRTAQTGSLLAALVVHNASHAADADNASPVKTSSAAAESQTEQELPGGAKLRLSRDARIELAGTRQLPLDATNVKTRTQVVKLMAGRVDVWVPSATVPKTAVLILGPRETSGVVKAGRGVAIVNGGTAVVHVNMNPATVAWQRSGNQLSAVVPPSKAPGPWIVKVEVKDERGNAVASDFAQVNPSTR